MIATILGLRAALSVFFSKMPPKVLLALGCALALLLGVLWHHHEVKVTIAKAKSEQRAADQPIINGLRNQLNAISTAKNQQAETTKTNIVTVTKVVHDADGVAKKIEAAPSVPGCKTPPAVLQADI